MWLSVIRRSTRAMPARANASAARVRNAAQVAPFSSRGSRCRRTGSGRRSDLTSSSLRRRSEAGVKPEFVSIGNEVNSALVEVSRWTSEADYYALFKSASAAVRAASPPSKVVSHLTVPDKWGYNDVRT
jgi:hypothetical protein